MGLAEGLRRFFILPASPYGRICCRCCGHCAGPFRNLRLTLHLPVPPASSPHPRGSARASSARVACQGRRPPSAAHPPSRHASAAGHTAQRPLGDCDGSLSLSLYAAVEVCWFGDHPCQQVNMGREWGSHARLRPAACVLAPRRRATACLISFSVEQVEAPLPAEPTVPAGTRSCDRRTSGPTASAEPASPPAGSTDPAPSECPACAPLRPAWGFPPASPASARRFRSSVVPGWLANAVSGSRRFRRRSSHRRPHYLYSPSPAAMLPSGFLAHILPPSIDSCWLGFRGHSPPGAFRSLPFPLRGLHPLASKRSPVRSGYSAACRS